jgi:hypothetical protein
MSDLALAGMTKSFLEGLASAPSHRTATPTTGMSERYLIRTACWESWITAVVSAW